MSEELIEKVARALCAANNIDADSAAAFVTFRYDSEHPKGIMHTGRYEHGWDAGNPLAYPRNPNGTKAWQWFCCDAQAAIKACGIEETEIEE